MYNIKSFNINNLINDTSHFVNRLLAVEEEWLAQISHTNSDDAAQSYRDLCSKLAIENKWILMIDPDERALDCLLKSGDVDVSKVLQIATNKVNMSLDKIEEALLRGNCSAVIMPNKTSVDHLGVHAERTENRSGKRALSANELQRLEKCALRGRTRCIVVAKPALH